jgi:hypothetical protein
MTRIHGFESADVAEKYAVRLGVFAVVNYNKICQCDSRSELYGLAGRNTLESASYRTEWELE